MSQNITRYAAETRSPKYWQLAIYQLAYVNSSDLFLGTLIAYYAARPVERIFGTQKFTVGCCFEPVLLNFPLYPTCLAIVNLGRVSDFNRVCSAAKIAKATTDFIARYRLLARRPDRHTDSGVSPAVPRCPSAMDNPCVFYGVL